MKRVHAGAAALLALAILLYAAYFSFLTLTRYAAFEARALDLGNLNQAIWNTAHGAPFHLTNQPGIVNRLSLHVEPILIPIAALYRLNPRPETLLVLQAVIVALGALPLFALSRSLGSDWLALILALVYLLHPSIQAANWLEFHPVTLAPAFLLAAFYSLLAGRRGLYALFALLAAACKEEISLLVFMIGLYALLALRQRRLGLITMALALGWALFAVLGVQTTFAAGNIHWERYAYLGENPSEIVRALVTHPALVFGQLHRAGALSYLFLLLLPAAFLSLLAPEVLALALPSLAINLLADFPPMHEVTTLIYAAPIVPFVLVAAVMGIARLQRFVTACTARRGAQSELRFLIGGSVLVAALFAQWRFGYLPGGGNFRLYTVSEHHGRVEALLAQVPAAAKVSAQDKLNPHVSGRRTLYIFPRIDDADTVLVDVTGSAWPQHPNDLRRTVEDLLAGGFGVAAADHGALLLSRQAAAKSFPDAFYEVWRRPGHTPAQPASVDFGGALRLLDYAVAADANGELVTRLYWQPLKPLNETLRFYVAYLDESGAVLHDTLFYPPAASLWYPTTQWRAGETVLVQTLPWTLAEDRFGLAVGVYRGEDGWQVGDRLPVTASDPAQPLLEGGTAAFLGSFERSAAGGWEAVSAAGSPETQLGVTFGDRILLDGASVEEEGAAAGRSLPFTLYWRAASPPDFDYSLFAHLLDASGARVAQLDWQPNDLGIRLPMTAWAAGRPVIDRQMLLLPPDLAPGSYRLVVGVYNWQDGRRLPAAGQGVESGDAVQIAQVEIGGR